MHDCGTIKHASNQHGYNPNRSCGVILLTCADWPGILLVSHCSHVELGQLWSSHIHCYWCPYYCCSLHPDFSMFIVTDPLSLVVGYSYLLTKCWNPLLFPIVSSLLLLTMVIIPLVGPYCRWFYGGRWSRYLVPASHLQCRSAKCSAASPGLWPRWCTSNLAAIAWVKPWVFLTAWHLIIRSG